MTMRRTILSALTLVLAACASYEEVRLPTFDAATALAPTVQEPAFFTASQMPYEMPLAAPYVQLVGDFPPDWSECNQSWQLVRECWWRGLRPDFIVYASRGITSPGNSLQVSPTLSTGGIYGFSLSSTPVVRGSSAVTCYRLAPVSLGFVADGNWMVTHVGETARASGIQEGDSVQSIDGADVRGRTPAEMPPWLAAALVKQRGDVVEIVWIRPGTGRMSGKLVLRAREPMPADAKPWQLPEWRLR